MRREVSSLTRVSLLVAACAIAGSSMACGGDKTEGSASGSAAPAKSGAPTAQASATSTAATTGTAATPPSAPTGTSEVTKYMPKTCDKARGYLNVERVIGAMGEAGQKLQETALARMTSSGKPESEKAKKALAVFQEGGIDVTKGAREVAACFNSGKKTVVVVYVDMSKAKGVPADTFAKAFEAAEGKAPKREKIDGIDYMQLGDGSIGFIAPNVIALGENAEMIKPIAKGGDGAADFADAPKYVAWVKAGSTAKDKVDITIEQSGADFVVNALLPPFGAPTAEAAVKKAETDLAQMMPKLEQSPFKAGLPALKNLKLAAQGESVSAKTTFPLSMVAELTQAAVEMGNMKDLFKGF